MDTPSIASIKELRATISIQIKKIKPSDFADQKFGGELEYSAKGVIGGINAILIDVGALVKSPAKFIKVSTHAERNQFVTLLTSINNAATVRNLSKLAAYIDEIKPILRAWGIRNTDERQNEFIEHVDLLQRKATTLAESITSLEEILNASEELKTNIQEAYDSLVEKENDLAKKETEIATLLEESESIRKDMDELLEADQSRSEEVIATLALVKSHEEVITNFSKKVSQRETQLEDQATKSENFVKTLNNYRTMQEDIIKESSKLIESAKSALGYKTAEGLSAAFIEKYKEAKSDKSTENWITAAGIFFVCAIAIGIWVVWGNSTIALTTLVGRVTLIPILLGGAWFSASRYIKQKNLSEDYAYKSVLSKSIVGFSEQLSAKINKGEDYSYYVKSVLEEIHQDPLGRKRLATLQDEKGTDLGKILDGIVDITEKVEKLVKSARQNQSA